MTKSILPKIISYCFHPLLIPVLIFSILLNISALYAYTIPPTLKLTLIGITIFTCILFPLLTVFILLRFNIISSIYTETKEERVYPILAVAAFYYLTYILLKEFQVSAIFSYYMLGSTLLAILALFINFYKKISLHMVGIGSFTGLFAGLILRFGFDFNLPVIFGILMGGVVGYARLKSNAHQPTEIYSGFLMGVVVMTTIILLL